MKNIVLIENNQRVIDILSLELEQYFQANIIVLKSYNEFTELFSSNNKIDLIIARNLILDENDVEFPLAKSVLNDVYDQSIKIPVIVMGEIEAIGMDFEQLPDRFRVEELNRLIISALNFSEYELKKLKMPDYVSVPIKNFYTLETSQIDIYIKVSKTDGDQFIKRVHANDKIDHEMLKSYEAKKVRELFVKKEDHLNLLNDLILKAISKIKNVRSSGEGNTSVAAESFELSANLLETMGVGKHSVVLSKATIASMMETISDSAELHNLMNDLMSKKASYAYKRSYLISLYCYEVIPHMGWGTGDQLSSHFEKICWVSFFHDILLRDEDLIKISTPSQLKEANLSQEDYDLVNEHANRASTLVQSFSKTPQGIDVIIRQHHGVANGQGFLDKYNIAISPMAILFIVIESFVAKLMELPPEQLENKESIKAITTHLESVFTTSSFKRILQILRGLI
jgi:HD-GYP domain-containing protein (c-di-GMP phosphodiesterase class II)